MKEVLQEIERLLNQVFDCKDDKTENYEELIDYLRTVPEPLKKDEWKFTRGEKAFTVRTNFNAIS